MVEHRVYLERKNSHFVPYTAEWRYEIIHSCAILVGIYAFSQS
jgi:hypothetical protein